MTFDPSKPVQTRDGRKARIVCTDTDNGRGGTILALIDDSDGDGNEHPFHYLDTGMWAVNRQGHDEGLDLINIPETHEVVAGFYEMRVKGARVGVAVADVDEPPRNTSYVCIASKRITFTEGEFED